MATIRQQAANAPAASRQPATAEMIAPIAAAGTRKTPAPAHAGNTSQPDSPALTLLEQSQGVITPITSETPITITRQGSHVGTRFIASD